MTIRGTTALAGAAVALCLTFGLSAVAQEAPWYNGSTVFEHVIPNTEGKSMVAVVVNYPPGGKSPAHHHAPSAFIYAHVLSGAIPARLMMSPLKSTRSAKASTRCPARITGSVRTRVTRTLRAYWLSSSSIPMTVP